MKRKKLKKKLAKTSVRSHVVTSKHGLNNTRNAFQYLAPRLPQGWHSFFTSRHAGKYYGLSIKCPDCDVVPPKELNGYSKWRWLTVHIKTDHENTKRS
jgi:hypothetical protein